VLPFLHSGFLRSAERVPERLALKVQGRNWTYAALFLQARRLAATIQKQAPDACPLVAVFADRSVTAFAGILGALMAGRGYVPLNPNFPVAKTRQMLRRSGSQVLIADAAAVSHIPAVVDGLLPPLTVVVPETSDASWTAAQCPAHNVVAATALEAAESWRPAAQRSGDIAYLLFTSGSTGAPKGVMVTHWNATHFVHSAVARYQITADDRLSQLFDTTFDLSVFDMFVAWQQGAAVCCPPRESLWNPATFVREEQLTVWFSVPSTAMLMNRLGALKPGTFPSLRWSLFCGERLSAETANAWASAAPLSLLENLYGPTELTVACTAYRWDPSRSFAECEGGIVPIGHPLPGMYAVVVDEQLNEVAPGQPGELLVTGPQRTPGYWQDSSATEKALAHVEGWAERFYRTGDRVCRPRNGEPLRFLGRVDHQIKVRGYRVELGEVESALRQVPGVQAAAALGWPATPAGVLGIAAFVTGDDIEPGLIRSTVETQLQAYAVPQTIHVLPTLPLNANGKVDRHALAALLGS
jgi:amino acid adenylation domain-containing protein